MAAADSDDTTTILERAFDLVDELNNIQNTLSREYSLKIDSLDVSTMQQSHSVYSFKLTVSRDIKRPKR